ncbi:MAG: tRNA (adenosine(37)-N6)-dimethylallyltransferase MiaA [Arcobacter sp.]|nr:MAG: tRNA (adenosine(37)-N6)-dimethylallyltransferase MiaA [Arcobacter sp.]
MKLFAIIAPTASGKTALSIELAHKLNAVILSLDSLAVYKQIDIASAKPTLDERDGIVHFGIDCVYPNEVFDVIEFYEEYEKAKKYAQSNNKNLIIVGGTGFYLKALIDGLSKTPTLSKSTKELVQNELLELPQLYEKLYSVDKVYMKKIALNDRYRIKKAAEIYFETQLTPSEYFLQNKPKPIVSNLPIFEIETDSSILKDRIKKRTHTMLKDGLIDEVIFLEKNYTRAQKCMNSIGISETFEYLDCKIDRQELENLICIHTAQLAKRQRTFNKSQFKNVIKAELKDIKEIILSHS